MLEKRPYLKKIVILMLAAVVISLWGCGKEAGRQEDKILIGVVVYDEYDTFISQMMDSFMGYVSNETMEGKRISVLHYESGGSQITQNDQVEELIDKKCDVLCVNLVDRTDPTMIIEAARKADIPVIFFNRELVEKDLQSWDKLYYVGADALDSGIIEGQIAADAWKESLEGGGAMDKNGDGILQYIIIEGEAGHQDAIVRTEYSVNTLVEAGITVDRLDSVIANWSRAQAQTKMSQIYNKYGDSIELIMCNNDDMALGVIDEYEAMEVQKKDRPVIIGIDGTDVGLEAVKNKQMYGTVYNDKEGQAKSMLELAIAAATGASMDKIELFDGKYIRYPYERITRENIKDYMKEEGDGE